MWRNILERYTMQPFQWFTVHAHVHHEIHRIYCVYSNRFSVPFGSFNRSKYIMWTKLFMCVCVFVDWELLSLLSSQTIGFFYPPLSFGMYSNTQSFARSFLHTHINRIVLPLSFVQSNVQYIHSLNINKSIEIKRFRCFFLLSIR